MTDKTAFDDFRKELNGRPDKPIVLGVCMALSKRFELEPWVTRVVAIIVTLMFTFPALLGYIVLGYLLDETRERTTGLFQGLKIWCQERFNSWGRRHQSGTEI